VREQIPHGFLFPVVEGQSFYHGGKNANLVQRGFSDSIIVICHARVSMLPLDQAESADQDKEVCDGIANGGVCGGRLRPGGGLPRPG
jgi:hypothetical protein